MPQADCDLGRRLECRRVLPDRHQWIWQARDRGAKLIVADPRQTPIARTADLWLPLSSGTDSALLNAMLNVVIHEGLVDEEFIRSAPSAGTR